MRVLVVNAGSSSLKLRLLAADDEPLDERHVEDWDGEDVGPIAELLATHGAVDAVGHRVVHGGTDYTGPTVIDDGVVDRLRALVSLAPLHQPRSLAGVAAARRAVPEVPHVACFDTAFHATLPPSATTYALPAPWRKQWPVRRFGFHGLSHAYAVRRVAELVSRLATARPGGMRVISCHLGAGASLCAALAGRAQDTTMGFTPLEGLVMATRSGTVDPGLVLWLITEAGLSPDEVRDGLERSAGLEGLAGVSDMRAVLQRRDAGDEDASLAFDVYVHAVARHAAALTASVGGLDVLVFTGGVGEHAAQVRGAVARRLGYLGVALDTVSNVAATGPGDHDVGSTRAPVSTLVIEAREDLEIARGTRTVLAEASRSHVSKR